MEKISVAIYNKKHGKALCEIGYIKKNPVELYIASTHFGKLVEDGDNLFDALVKLRVRLEKDGWFLLCNVARIDAYPSQMMLQMALGRKIYILKHGAPARRDDIVDIFGEATLDQVGTVQEQREYHQSWLRSLGNL